MSPFRLRWSFFYSKSIVPSEDLLLISAIRKLDNPKQLLNLTVKEIGYHPNILFYPLGQSQDS